MLYLLQLIVVHHVKLTDLETAFLHLDAALFICKRFLDLKICHLVLFCWLVRHKFKVILYFLIRIFVVAACIHQIVRLEPVAFWLPVIVHRVGGNTLIVEEGSVVRLWDPFLLEAWVERRVRSHMVKHYLVAIDLRMGAII